MAAPSSTSRVFIAIDPPEAAKGALTSTIHELQQHMPDSVRWVRPSGIHLTLKFLGEVQTPVVDDILAAMQLAAREFRDGGFQLSLSGLGVFPNQRQPRVLWAGVQGDLAALGKLHLSVDKATLKLGFKPERGPFRPHITLGRVRDQVPPRARGLIGETISAREPPVPVAWEVDAIHLIRSHIQPGGAIYTIIGSSYLS